MSVADNKLLVRRYYEEVVNTGDMSQINEFVSPIYAEEAKAHILGVRRTYPDLHLTIDQQVAEGEWVVTRVTAWGTHLGVWLGMKPTGSIVEMTAVNMDRVVGGFIVEHCGAANALEPLMRIGAIRIADPVKA